MNNCIFTHNIANVPTRFSIAVMLFFACFFSYMLRVNMSINVLAMVQHTDENGTVIEEENVCKLLIITCILYIKIT